MIIELKNYSITIDYLRVYLSKLTRGHVDNANCKIDYNFDFPVIGRLGFAIDVL